MIYILFYSGAFFCLGRRTHVRTVQANDVPPLLLFPVGDLVQLNFLETDIRKYPKAILFGDIPFRLAGATLHRPGHFFGIIQYGTDMLVYDGLRNGRLAKLRPNDLRNSILEHVGPIYGIKVTTG
jgi:hypothetical protein